MSQHVLVAEDDRDISETLVDLLRDGGYTVHSASDDKLARDLLRLPVMVRQRLQNCKPEYALP